MRISDETFNALEEQLKEFTNAFFLALVNQKKSLMDRRTLQECNETLKAYGVQIDETDLRGERE